jgi:NTP pyrophosphatase (non-canonical NTP hydrolase)
MATKMLQTEAALKVPSMNFAPVGYQPPPQSGEHILRSNAAELLDAIGKAIKEPLEKRTLMQSKTEKELTEVLDRVFLVALLITGNMDGAEEAVLDGIAALDDTMSSDGFLLATLKSAIEMGEQRSGETEDIFPSVPLELRRILLLNPDLRACFVVRVLLGMPSETCSEVLQIPTQKIGHSVSDAMQQLAVLGSTTRTGYCRTSDGKSDK